MSKLKIKRIEMLIKFGKDTVKDFKFPVKGSEKVEYEEWKRLCLEFLKAVPGEQNNYSNFEKISSSIQNPNVNKMIDILLKVKNSLIK